MAGLGGLVYGAYERRLAQDVARGAVPRHVGVILDGNRRWARSSGASHVHDGHRRGAAKVVDLLDWCEQSGVAVVTLWLLSTDNLARPEAELRPLLGTIEDLVTDLADRGRWRVHPLGALDLLPSRTSTALKAAEERTRTSDGIHVNVAVAYGGRREIADAVRSLLLDGSARGLSLEEMATSLDVQHIAEHLYTRGQPDPDLVIRTSGEQRLSGFLLWQSAHSEFSFCDAYWPDFRHVDFLRALRDYGRRERRLGG